MIHARDAVPLAKAWLRAVPDVHAQYPYLLAEMYGYSMAAANLSLPHAQVHHLMVSNVGAGGEGWPFVDRLPPERACDPTLLDDEAHRLPFFLHYCQRYEHVDKPPYADTAWIFSKYQVPDEILQCPAGSASLEDAPRAAKKQGGDRKRMKLADDGFLPEPPVAVDYPESTKTKRNVFSFCIATRRTNLAARDYRRWFCEQSHAAR